LCRGKDQLIDLIVYAINLGTNLLRINQIFWIFAGSQA